MSSVWGMILQWGGTIKLRIEIPVATRHRRDMTEKVLKATLNNNYIAFSQFWSTLTAALWVSRFVLSDDLYFQERDFMALEDTL